MRVPFFFLLSLGLARSSFATECAPVESVLLQTVVSMADYENSGRVTVDKTAICKTVSARDQDPFNLCIRPSSDLRKYCSKHDADAKRLETGIRRLMLNPPEGKVWMELSGVILDSTVHTPQVRISEVCPPGKPKCDPSEKEVKIYAYLPTSGTPEANLDYLKKLIQHSEDDIWNRVIVKRRQAFDLSQVSGPQKCLPGQVDSAKQPGYFEKSLRHFSDPLGVSITSVLEERRGKVRRVAKPPVAKRPPVVPQPVASEVPSPVMGGAMPVMKSADKSVGVSVSKKHRYGLKVGDQELDLAGCYDSEAFSSSCEMDFYAAVSGLSPEDQMAAYAEKTKVDKKYMDQWRKDNGVGKDQGVARNMFTGEISSFDHAASCSSPRSSGPFAMLSAECEVPAGREGDAEWGRIIRQYQEAADESGTCMTISALSGGRVVNIGVCPPMPMMGTGVGGGMGVGGGIESNTY